MKPDPLGQKWKTCLYGWAAEAPHQGSFQGNQVDLMPPVNSHTDTNFPSLNSSPGLVLKENSALINVSVGLFFSQEAHSQEAKALQPLRQKDALSCRTLHNMMRAVSSRPPFKDFSRRLLCLWLKKQIMFCHPHYEQKNTCFQFRETKPECRHEEWGPNRAIAMMPMTPWVFMREISQDIFQISNITTVFTFMVFFAWAQLMALIRALGHYWNDNRNEYFLMIIVTVAPVVVVFGQGQFPLF